jgi:hypothetical protein
MFEMSQPITIQNMKAKIEQLKDILPSLNKIQTEKTQEVIESLEDTINSMQLSK